MTAVVPATPTTVVLTGTTSSDNKGDATMQYVVWKELTEALKPSGRVVIASPSPDRDREFYAGPEVVFSSRRSRGAILITLTLSSLWGFLRTVFRVRADWLLRTDELREVRRADMVVDLSGDMLTEDYGFLIGFSHFVPLIQARYLRTPYVICAQSIGPFKRLRPIARWILRGAAAITIREDVTRERVAGLGLDMETTADVAFLLEPDVKAADAILRRHGIAKADRLVGVSVSPILSKRFESANPGQSFAQTIARVLDTSLKGTSSTVVFIPHVTGPFPRHDDRIIARQVAEHLKTPHALVEDDVPPAVLKGLVSRMDIVLGARMHANMAALSQGVPLLALSYSHKTAGIMTLFGQEDAMVDGKAMTEQGLIDGIRRISKERAARAKAIRAHLPEIQRRSRLNITRIVDLIAANSTEKR